MGQDKEGREAMEGKDGWKNGRLEGKKLSVDFRKYIILGACNPPLAHQTLQAELEIGLLLPCNVIVYENDEGKSVVSAIDPVKMVSIVDNPVLGELAQTVSVKLRRAIENV